MLAKVHRESRLEDVPCFWMGSRVEIQYGVVGVVLFSLIIIVAALVKQIPGHGRQVFKRAEMDLKSGAIDSVYLS